MSSAYRPRDMYTWHTREQVQTFIQDSRLRVLAFRNPEVGESFIPACTTKLVVDTCRFEWVGDDPRFIVEKPNGV